MSDYLIWDKTTISDFSENAINEKYQNGYVFTREHKGSMYRTRSLRIDLNKYQPSSENRRVLNKVEGLNISALNIPLIGYDWRIHKLGKDYYERKFGPNVFSANKIKELITADLNFNSLFKYEQAQELVGYAITYHNASILHYAYPFYDLDKYPNNYGMGMMLKAISFAKEKGCQYIYLGSASRPADTYKLQFSGLEWFDGSTWQEDIPALKELITSV